jgi:neutral ceramidase
VIQQLEFELGGYELNHQNVILSATHTHSGAAGYMQYILFEVSSGGFVEQTFQALVSGITRVISDKYLNNSYC